MTFTHSTFFLILAVLLAACSGLPQTPPALDRQHYVLNGPGRCDTTTNRGVDVVVSYFLLGDSTGAARSINDSLRHLAMGSIIGWLDSASVAQQPDARTDLDKAARLFAASYDSVAGGMGNFNACWQLETKADTVFASPKVLSVRFETYAYTGGAHPNTNTAFYTFDRQTGHGLTLRDVVADTTALKTVVERAFRHKQDVSARVSLEDHGYFLRDGQFFLPANWALGRNGMLFYYNPYEIAAYVVGPIEVIIPYAQLNGILRKEWSR